MLDHGGADMCLAGSINKSDEDFLRVVLQSLERLRQASEDRGHGMLASMIELARTEAEDDLRTRALEKARFAEFRAVRYTPEGSAKGQGSAGISRGVNGNRAGASASSPSISRRAQFVLDLQQFSSHVPEPKPIGSVSYLNHVRPG